MGHDPLAVRAGTHELEVEALVDVRGAGAPVRLRARQPVVIAHGSMYMPLGAALRLTFGARSEASMPDSRLTLDLDPVTVTEAPPPPPPVPAAPGPLVPDLRLRVAGEDPSPPAELGHRGAGWKVRTEICVGPEGRVQSIELLDAAPARDPRSDAIVIEALRRWRYGSYRVDGVLRGFCHLHDADLAAH